MKRIKYVSQFSRDLDRGEITALAARAAQANAEKGITGILMTAGRLFFQVIEGPNLEMDALYAKICADDRHEDVLLLGVEDPVSGRVFPDWAMRKFDLDDAADARLQPVRELLRSIHAARLDLRRQTNELERAVWRELATALR